LAVKEKEAQAQPPVVFRLERQGELQVLNFEIPGGVIEPSDLQKIAVPRGEIDPSRPVVISGRGPSWLYGYLVHELHYARILATFEPRVNKGIVAEAPSKELIGKAVDASGVSDVSLGAKGTVSVKKLDIDNTQVVYVKVEGDRFVEPSVMRSIEYPEVDWSRPVVVYGQMPMWLFARLSAEYANKAPWFGIYDPRLGGAVVVARHSKSAPVVGSVVPLDARKVEETAQRQ